MKARRKSRTINIVSLSFLDVLANGIGALAFLLVMALLIGGRIILTPPIINTEELPDGYVGREYVTWLGAREGGGQFHWAFGGGEIPRGLSLDPVTGKLSGLVARGTGGARGRTYKFEVRCSSTPDEGGSAPEVDKRSYSLTVYDSAPVQSMPLRIRTAGDLPTALLGKPYPLVLAAEGGQAPYSWSAGGGLPPGMVLSADGRLEGVAQRTGSYSFSVTVTPEKGASEQERMTLEVVAHEPPPPPVPLEVVTDRVPAAVSERDYGIWLAARGGSQPYTWTASGLPRWISRTDSAGCFAGTPTIGDVGRSRVVFEVRDVDDQTARSEPIELAVLPPVREPEPLRLRTATLPDATTGRPYSLAFAVEGGVPPYEWSYPDEAVPGGMEFAEDGVLSGAPDAPGDYSGSLTVTDQTGRDATRDYALRVHPPVTPVEILSERLPAGRAGREYWLALSATGGRPPYSWDVVSGALPEGVALDPASGVLSGMPTRAGSWGVGLSVLDSESSRAQEPLEARLEVLTAEGTRELTIRTRALPTLFAGRAADVALACEGGAPPYRWSADPALPTGLRLEDGRIVGTTLREVEREVTFTVVDASGQQASAMFVLTVVRVAPFWLTLILIAVLAIALIWLLRAWRRERGKEALPLKILTESIPNARAGCAYSVRLACMGGAAPYKWELVEGSLPPGLQLTAEGVIHGIPFEDTLVDETKEIVFTVRVTDRTGSTARQRL